MSVFITVKFKRGENKSEVEHLCSLVQQAGLEDFCFIRDVEHYQKIFNGSQELMNRALEEIRKCDALLIDMTNKPTGRAVEAGMAYAMGKKLILIMRKGTFIKDTVRGIAGVIIVYSKLKDIVEPLSQWKESLPG